MTSGLVSLKSSHSFKQVYLNQGNNHVSSSPFSVFFLVLFFHFFNLFFNWGIIALQNFVGFSQTSTWISHRYTYVPFNLHQALLKLPLFKQVFFWQSSKVCFPYCIIAFNLFIINILKRKLELKREKQSYVMKYIAEPTEVFLQCNLGREMKSRQKKKKESELAKSFIRKHYSLCWNRTNFLANPK